MLLHVNRTWSYGGTDDVAVLNIERKIGGIRTEVPQVLVGTNFSRRQCAKT